MVSDGHCDLNKVSLRKLVYYVLVGKESMFAILKSQILSQETRVEK